MSIKRFLAFGAIALAVFVLARPADASGAVQSALHGLGSAGTSVATFARGLLS